MPNKSSEQKPQQPWKKIWPPQEPVQAAGLRRQDGKVVLIEGGGAYPNKIKETEGCRL